MVRFAAAAAALAYAGFWVSNGHATATRGSGVPPAASGALITDCYRRAEWIVPRMRGRSAWVVRHADHCVRSGGSL
jgi:hypothetical protein